MQDYEGDKVHVAMNGFVLDDISKRRGDEYEI